MTARRAIESLRSGVPSGAAVHALGWPITSHTHRFEGLLAKVEAGAGGPRGLLVKGDFGSGKSHLLGHLEQLALERRFVVSRVVISKETPLFKPELVFAAAVRDGKVPPYGRGAVLHEIAPMIDFRSRSADGLQAWVAHVPAMLGGSIYLLNRTVELGDDELVARIIDWWAGEKLAPFDVKAGLRKLGSQHAFDVRKIRAADLVDLRIALTSHIILAAGFAGWLILLDELELVGRYSSLQRATSYAQLARWFGLGGSLGTSIGCVGTITADFVSRILDCGPIGRDDRERLPDWLRRRARPGDAELASLASDGMGLIDEDAGTLRLAGPDGAVLRRTYDRVLEVYRAAFNWSPPHGMPKLDATTTPMRTYIKTWIYEWDLVRLGVTTRPSIGTEAMPQSYEEDTTLQESGDDEGDEDGSSQVVSSMERTEWPCR